MLSTKALLIYVSIFQWAGRKSDQKANKTVESQHATKDKTGNYTKKLLPGSKELEKIGAAASLIRAAFYKETLPWFSDGARIISSKNYLTFAADFQRLKSNFEQSVNDFLVVYPTLRLNAQSSLGSLYNTNDYPHESLLREKFQCEISVMPLPDVKDFRTDIGENEKKAFIEKMKSVESNAMLDCWTRLHDVVSKASERLSDPKASFRDSLLENVTEICRLLPRLNITENPDLETARQKIESLVSTLTPQKLRDSTIDRQDAATKLDEITRSMGAFMGKV
jgi:hypothetical protein